MIFSFHQGDLLTSTAPLILQAVNCQGAMNSGLAKAIREKWGIVYDKYSEYCSKFEDKKELLGKVLPVTVSDTQKVLNLFTQEKFGYDGQRYTSYDALDTCLGKVGEYCEVKSIERIALPFKMCSVRGGASWLVVMEIIKDQLNDKKIEIEIWDNTKN